MLLRKLGFFAVWGVVGYGKTIPLEEILRSTIGCAPWISLDLPGPPWTVLREGGDNCLAVRSNHKCIKSNEL